MLYRYSLILFFALVLHGDFCVAAPTIHFQPTPKWVITSTATEQAPDMRDITEGYYQSLYELEENVALDETYHHIINTIVSDAGVQNASDISINFNPAYQQLIVHSITVWRNGQPINKLEKDEFKIIANEADLSKFMYDGTYKAYLILKDVRKGDKVECAYTIAGRNTVFGKKVFDFFNFQGGSPVSEVHCCLLAPASLKINMKFFNGAEKPVVRTEGNTVVYEWDVKQVKGIKSSQPVPTWYSPYPGVQLSEYQNWGEIADWAYALNTPEKELKGELGKRLGQLERQYGSDSEALFHAIVAIVQNEVRYMGVEIGPYSHKANPPEKVYEQRYGDCKDKSLLLVSMLKSAGIPAEMALVNTRLKAKITDYLPSPTLFDHAIVHLSLYRNSIWIDPTIAEQGGSGANFFCPYYGKALLLMPGNTALTPIPELPSGAIDRTENYNIYDAQKPVLLTVSNAYTLNMADAMRNIVSNESRSELEKNYLEYYAKIYPSIESTDTMTIYDNEDINEVDITLHYSIPDFLRMDSSTQNYNGSVYAYSIKNQLPTADKAMSYPLGIVYPYRTHCTVHIYAPINWQIEKVHHDVIRDAYSFTSKVFVEYNRLSLEYSFETRTDNIAPGDLKQYEADRKNMTENYLGYSFYYRAPNAVHYTGVNYLAIIIMLLLMCCCAYAGVRIYNMRTTNYEYTSEISYTIGGWLILPFMGLIVSAPFILYSIVKGGLLGNRLWHVYDGLKASVSFKAFLWGELVFNSIDISFAVFCLILFFNKRDILPRYIKIFYLYSLGLVLADSVVGHLLFPAVAIDYAGILRNIVVVSIWVPYFIRSGRVQGTFIVRHPKEKYVYPGYLADEPEYVNVPENVNNPEPEAGKYTQLQEGGTDGTEL